MTFGKTIVEKLSEHQGGHWPIEWILLVDHVLPLVEGVLHDQKVPEA